MVNLRIASTLHCLKNILNLPMKTEPVTNVGGATVYMYVWGLCQTYVHKNLAYTVRLLLLRDRLGLYAKFEIIFWGQCMLSDLVMVGKTVQKGLGRSSLASWSWFR